MKNRWVRRLTGVFICALCLCTLSGCKKTEKEVIKQMTEPEFEAEDIRELTVTQNGEVSYQLVYEPRDDRESFLYWDLKVPYQSIATVNTEEIYKLFGVFAGIEWKNGESEGSKDLENTDTKITVTYYDKDTSSDISSDASTDSSAEESKEAHAKPNRTATILVGEKEDNSYECAVEGGKSVYHIKDYQIDAVLNEKPYDMILRVPFLLDIKSVKEVDMEWDRKRAELKSDKDGGTLNGDALNQENYNSIYSMLLQCSMTGEVPAGTDVTKGKRELLKLTYHRTKKEFEEYQVRFYEYDDQNDVVDINGKVTFLVSNEDVVALLGCLDKL